MKAQFSKIRKVRKDRKLTLRELSEATGIDVSTLSKFERGLRDVRIGQLKLIVEALGISMEAFFDEAQ